MPNITFSVSKELYEKMKKYSEIKWSSLYRKMIEQYIEKLEHSNIQSISELRNQLRKKNISMDDLTHEKIIESYKKMRELEWERFYSTRTG